MNSAEWTAAVAGMAATWTDCPLIDEPDRARSYRRTLGGHSLDMIAEAVAILASEQDRFPSIAAFSAVCQAILHARRLGALAHASLLPPKPVRMALEEFDRGWDEIVNGRKSEFQDFAREHQMSVEWLARRFAECEVQGPTIVAMRQTIADGRPFAEIADRIRHQFAKRVAA